MRAFPYQSIYDQSQTPPWDRLTDTTDHRTEAMANWTNGVYPGKDGWKVEPGAGMTVKVKPGMGRIQGVFCYDNEGTSGELEPRTLALQAAHASLDRIDCVVVRHQDAQSLRITDWYILTGTPGQKPTAPTLTRTAEVYELCVATVFVPKGTNLVSSQRITDTRLDSNLCGLCTTRVMDMALEDIKALLDAAIDKTAAGHLQTQININKDGISKTTKAIESIKSYAVERKEEGWWSWTKYSDGTAELTWKAPGATLNAGVAWAGGYYHTQTSWAEYPITFAETPKLISQVKEGAILAIPCGAIVEKNRINAIWVNGVAERVLGDEFGPFTLVLRGRWKSA